VPVDPVCGIELDEDLALIHDHDGKAEGFSSKNLASTKIIRWEKLHTFYKTLIFQPNVCSMDIFHLI
jgi:hypothetical protein